MPYLSDMLAGGPRVCELPLASILGLSARRASSDHPHHRRITPLVCITSSLKMLHSSDIWTMSPLVEQLVVANDVAGKWVHRSRRVDGLKCFDQCTAKYL